MSVTATPANAAHLLRRAAWGGLPTEIARVVDDGIESSVDRLFDPEAAEALAAPKAQNGFLPYEHEALVGWFAHTCITSPMPAIERLTWFWHGHFATSVEKVEMGDLMVQQFAKLRRWGLGRFDDLLTAIANDGAMNLWLDLHLSVKGKPNANFARELLELFSMGASNGYEQGDVVAAARAFTGHVLELDPRYERPIGSRINPGLHDRGTKTFLGRSGSFDGGDIVSMIVERPECHRFVARRFWHRYAGTAPAPAVIDDLAQAFARRFEIRDLLVALLTHPAFYGDDVKNGLVAQPVEVATRTLRGFEVGLFDVAEYTLAEIDRDDERLLSGGVWHLVDVMEWLAGMGQVPMLPPTIDESDRELAPQCGDPRRGFAGPTRSGHGRRRWRRRRGPGSGHRTRRTRTGLRTLPQRVRVARTRSWAAARSLDRTSPRRRGPGARPNARDRHAARASGESRLLRTAVRRRAARQPPEPTGARRGVCDCLIAVASSGALAGWSRLAGPRSESSDARRREGGRAAPGSG